MHISLLVSLNFHVVMFLAQVPEVPKKSLVIHASNRRLFNTITTENSVCALARPVVIVNPTESNVTSYPNLSITLLSFSLPCSALALLVLVKILHLT